MPLRNWLFRINDILDAVSAIETYVTGMTYEDFVADRKTVDAVVRNLIIIGEATVHIPREICTTQAEIPWQRDIIKSSGYDYAGSITWLR